MKLRHPFLIRAAAFAGAWILRGWVSTLCYRKDGRATGGLPQSEKLGRCLYVFWHEHMLAASTFGKNVEVLISKHADGELITQLTHHMGMKAVRGSSRRGGAGAILEILRSKRSGHFVLTPDGPRGPRRQAQSGVIFLASKSGLPVMPVGFGYESAWRARSWDRLALPLPYSLVTLVAAPPIHVPPNLDRAGLEFYRQILQERLDHANEDAERWAEGRPRLIQELPAPILARSA